MSRGWRLVRSVLVLVTLGAMAWGFSAAAEPDTWPEPGLRTNESFRLEPTDAIARQVLAGDVTWVDQGTDPGRGTPWADMSHWALMDLRRLTSSPGGPPAGAAESWGYFWPRDGAFIALALARTGHPEDARRIVDFMARLPFDPRRGFDARYLLSGEKVTSAPRGPQSDGCGWVLWSLAELRAWAPGALPPSAVGLREQCVKNLLRLTDDGARIPPPSPDYWELPVKDTTLGTVAPMVAGLRGAAADYAATGRPDRAATCDAASRRLARKLAREFGPDYERYGDRGGMDAAVAVLLPPFAPPPSDAVRDRWTAYQSDALRVSGGLAPGAGWRNDGTSWTPETALIAYTAAASGDRATAVKWLTWLSANRAAWGSLPEKVTASGRPAGPAPLLWTGALVLLTLDELNR